MVSALLVQLALPAWWWVRICGPGPGLGVGFPSPPGGIGPPPALCGGPVVLLWVLCGLGRLPGTSAGPHRAILAILYPQGSAHNYDLSALQYTSAKMFSFPKQWF